MLTLEVLHQQGGDSSLSSSALHGEGKVSSYLGGIHATYRATYRGYNKEYGRGQFVRFALGRNNQIRPISFEIGFEDCELKREFLREVEDCTIKVGDKLYLSVTTVTRRRIFSVITAWRIENQENEGSGLLCPP